MYDLKETLCNIHHTYVPFHIALMLLNSIKFYTFKYVHSKKAMTLGERMKPHCGCDCSTQAHYLIECGHET